MTLFKYSNIGWLKTIDRHTLRRLVVDSKHKKIKFYEFLTTVGYYIQDDLKIFMGIGYNEYKKSISGNSIWKWGDGTLIPIVLCLEYTMEQAIIIGRLRLVQK